MSTTKKEPTNRRKRGDTKKVETKVPEPTEVIEEVPPPPPEEFNDIPSDQVTLDSESIPGNEQLGEENNAITNNKEKQGLKTTSVSLVSSKKSTKKNYKEKLKAHREYKAQELYFGNKQLKQVPDDIFQYKALHVLWLNDNKIEQLIPLVTEYRSKSDELIQSNTMAYEQSFSQSALAVALQRKKFSGAVFLTELYLHKNKIKSIDGSGIRYLKHLKVLSLHTNLLRDLDRVLDNLRNNHLHKLDLFNNPCAHEESYRERVLKIVGRTLHILDRHVVTEEEKKSGNKKTTEENKKTVVFGASFVPQPLPERVGMISSSVKELEERCNAVREQKARTQEEKQIRKQTKREREFQKTFLAGIPKSPKDSSEEDNIYTEILNKYQELEKKPKKQQVSGKDYLKTFWAKVPSTDGKTLEL